MEDQVFKTKDTNLAAYLLSCGADYVEAKIDDNTCVFIFLKDNKTMEVFNNFKKDAWLKNYNDNKRFCLNTIRDLKSQRA